jgi:hypothetical protein
MSGVSCRDGERVRQQLDERQFAQERRGSVLFLLLRQRIELRQLGRRWRLER